MSRGGGVEVEVAIKVLRPDLEPESQGVQRLRDEGRLLGRLTHPTILRVYDLVVIQGRAALVSEYVAGEDLGRLLREDRIPPRAVFEVVAQVGAALDAAWSWPSVTDGKALHLVHRDVKPDNIRIDPHGVVKLLDFGIAQAQTVWREAQTSVNTIMGSTHYLAPERLVQQEVGPEADVFALGCTLFEALTGEALFARKSMRQMYVLMVDERRFEEFLVERCEARKDRLGGERSIALLRAMTAWRKQSRPTGAEVASRCDTISDTTEGSTLTQWCRARTWPEARGMEGPLDGYSFVTSQPATPDEQARHKPSIPPPLVAPPIVTLQLATPPAPVAPELDPDRTRPAEVQRPSVLGESGGAAMVSNEGPLPWSPAEMVAVMASAPEVALRIPQLGRQSPEPNVQLPLEVPVEAAAEAPPVDVPVVDTPPTVDGVPVAALPAEAERPPDPVSDDTPAVVAPEPKPERRVEEEDAETEVNDAEREAELRTFLGPRPPEPVAADAEIPAPNTGKDLTPGFRFDGPAPSMVDGDEFPTVRMVRLTPAIPEPRAATPAEAAPALEGRRGLEFADVPTEVSPSPFYRPDGEDPLRLRTPSESGSQRPPRSRRRSITLTATASGVAGLVVGVFGLLILVVLAWIARG